MDEWKPFDSSRSLETIGSEGGTIVLDDEHADGARVTIERGGHTAPFSITCGIYGWMVHTRFFSTETEARRECAEMKTALSDLIRELGELELKGDHGSEAGAACARFVERFP